MDDLISRQAAIDAINRAVTKEAARWSVEELPSAEPKRGMWIKLDMHRGMADHKCTACGNESYVPTCMGEPLYEFCPHCGAKMEVTE